MAVTCPRKRLPFCGAASISGHDFQRTVVVAMTVMSMVQTTVHQIADMVSVRDRLVPASGAMHVTLLVPETVISDRRAVIRVRGGDFDDMLVDVIFMRMMEVAVVQIVHMIAVAHSRMAAAGAVDVRVVFVFRVRTSHRFFP